MRAVLPGRAVISGHWVYRENGLVPFITMGRFPMVASTCLTNGKSHNFTILFILSQCLPYYLSIEKCYKIH